MRPITILLFLFSIFSSFAQRNDPNTRSGQMHSYNPMLSSTVNKFAGFNKNIKGSRFVFEKFNKQGKIYTNNQVYSANGLNIDALNKDLVLKVGKDSILVLEKNTIDSLHIDSKLFKKVADEDIFYEVLFENNHVSLLKGYDCHIKQGKTNVMMGTTENDSYIITEKYYLHEEGKSPYVFKPSKKNIFQFFKKKQSQIKTYIKRNNLNLNQEEDLIKLFHHYYSIKE